MSETLHRRLEASLDGTALLARLERVAAPFLTQRPQEDPALALDSQATRGLARVLATSAEASRYLARRPELLRRIGAAGRDALETRGRELQADPPVDTGEHLEEFLDALRIFRRDETVFAACLDLAGIVPFEEVSEFLSVVAETCVGRALAMAEQQVPEAPRNTLSILGMGKVAGREHSYHSDLDMIFLYPIEAAETSSPSRLAQRLIAYLSTMTAAGVAYEVDSRLRPSGRQGALVSTFAAFDHYQRERAATWEHMALMRARAVAGQIEKTQAFLNSLRQRLLAESPARWADVAEMRRRVEKERGRDTPGRLAIKAGAGGIMDIEFLAAGGLLESGGDGLLLAHPSVPSMLRASAGADAAEQLIEDYRFLRVVEARSRWVVGRAVDAVYLDDETGPVIAELVEPALASGGLEKRLNATRGRVRSSYRTVIEAGTIRALEG